MKKPFLWATANGFALALIAIALLGNHSPLPEPSALAGVEDRIHAMTHTLDELEHLYAQSMGCRLFMDRVSSPSPIPLEAK